MASSTTNVQQSRTRASFLGNRSLLSGERQVLKAHPPAGGKLPGDAVFVASPTNNAVYAFDADGKGGAATPLATFSESGLNQPVAVAIDGDNLYVGNLGDTPLPSQNPTGNGSISIFDTKSPANPAVTTIGPGPSQITSVNALAFSGDNLFVANGFPGGNVLVFSKHNLGSGSVPYVSFQLPTGTCAQPTGLSVTGNRLYVVDFFGGCAFGLPSQVDVYDISGHIGSSGPPLVATITAPATVASIGFDASGGDAIYADACCTPVGILIYNKNALGGAPQATVTDGFQQTGPTGSFVTGMAMKGDKLWVVDAGPGTLLEYQKKGNGLGSPVAFTTTYPAIGDNLAVLAGIALK